ncbi:YktB family protein [Pueribacillus sp. YX66]|uniref:YktB family protein n=1 Tax=Pueribacillus sp. YX66 TaxID=3229242 RepID=UPI00358CF2E8
MSLYSFSPEDFNVFQIEGLENRMEAIQTKIQPKFQVIGEELTTYLSAKLNMEMFLHIAKHARRTKNPPNDTWLAIANNKRGYKKHPHFQVGLFDDRVFIWLAFIYELPNKQQIAKTFMQHIDSLKSIPNNFVISQDHMKKAAYHFNEVDLNDILDRFYYVKKAELLIGRHIQRTDPILQNSLAFLKMTKTTFDALLPLYHLAIEQ